MILKQSMIVILFIFTSAKIISQQNTSLDITSPDAKILFVSFTSGNWGIEVSNFNKTLAAQPQPAFIEIISPDNETIKLSASYLKARKTASSIIAEAEIKYKTTIFKIVDKWDLQNNVLSVNRNIVVTGTEAGGFNSSINLKIVPSINWADIKLMIPGALYGDPTYNGGRSPAGKMNYDAKQIILREDMLAAPMFAMSFTDGSSLSILDPEPDGQTTVAETRLKNDVIIDSRFKFGSIIANQSGDQLVEIGFQFPGTMGYNSYRPDANEKKRWIRRFHPINKNTEHNYKVSFRLGKNESFREVSRNAWRWAWNTLKPEVTPIDIEQMRRVLIDHLADQAHTIEGRTGIPFAVATFDTTELQWNRTMSVMGFVSKTIECADLLLIESDRDTTEREIRMRKLGLNIISSLINALSDIPLEASGYDVATGKPWAGDHKEWLAPFLRNTTEDMRVLVKAYQRERKLGRLHLEWFNWVKRYVDWLILQQRDDGSFPRRWEPGSNVVAEETGSTTYCPIPLLIQIGEETDDSKYIQSAIIAGEYVWENWGKKQLFVGGTSDNPNIQDKEAGMLSLEAYLSLYEFTKDNKWLERAKAAADYTESWIWIWNVPMPVDADDKNLHWKKGIPTAGLQGINARGPGGTDEYLDWSAPSYAKLYQYTGDVHYLEVAKILLHNTKVMVAIPGRQYDMKAIGFQQEHWSMGPGRNGRGHGGHRFWLPWISANHLHSITGLEELDKKTYNRIIN